MARTQVQNALICIRIINLGWINMRAYKFLLMGHSSPVFCPTQKVLQLIRFKDVCGQTLKVPKSRQTLHVFLLFQIFRMLALQNFVPMLSCLSSGTSRNKVSWGYSHYPQNYRRAFAGIEAKFWPRCKKIGPSPVRYALAKFCLAVARVKIWGRNAPYGRNMVSRKS